MSNSIKQLEDFLENIYALISYAGLLERNCNQKCREKLRIYVKIQLTCLHSLKIGFLDTCSIKECLYNIKYFSLKIKRDSTKSLCGIFKSLEHVNVQKYYILELFKGK